MSDAASPDPGRARRGRPGYDAATVLRRAIDLFNTQGYDATSIGDLARELGLSKSAIYHHVPSKEFLLQAALDEALDALTRAVDAARAGGPGTDPGTRLRTAVEESVRILTAHLPAVTLLLRVRGNGTVEQDALRRRRAIDEAFAALVRDAASSGVVRDDLSPELISRLVFGTVNSLTEWWRPGGPIDPATLASAVSSLVFDGLGAP